MPEKQESRREGLKPPGWGLYLANAEARLSYNTSKSI